MEIKEIQELRDALERDLTNVLSVFEETTGVNIHDIDLMKLHKLGNHNPHIEGVSVSILV